MRPIDADLVQQDLAERLECYSESNDFGERVWRVLYEAMQYYINQVPTIEPKRGKWLPRNSGFLYWVRCSVCDERYYGYSDGCDFKFCPNCGAKMGGDNE